MSPTLPQNQSTEGEGIVSVQDQCHSVVKPVNTFQTTPRSAHPTLSSTERTLGHLRIDRKVHQAAQMSTARPRPSSSPQSSAMQAQQQEFNALPQNQVPMQAQQQQPIQQPQQLPNLQPQQPSSMNALRGPGLTIVPPPAQANIPGLPYTGQPILQTPGTLATLTVSLLRAPLTVVPT